jgi:AraC family transcriptional regulator
MSEPMPAILHLYLSPFRFSHDNLGTGFDTTAIRSVCHEGGFHDPLLAEIAYAIMSELEHENRR